jgi:hypothetical protein
LRKLRRWLSIDGIVQFRSVISGTSLGLIILASRLVAAPDELPADSLRPKLTILDPPEQDFFSKRLDFHGIPIQGTRGRG